MKTKKVLKKYSVKYIYVLLEKLQWKREFNTEERGTLAGMWCLDK